MKHKKLTKREVMKLRKEYRKGLDAHFKKQSEIIRDRFIDLLINGLK